MLEQQYIQQITDTLKSSSRTHDNVLKENNSDDNASSNADQISSEICNSNQIWTNSLDNVTSQMFQSLNISTTNPDTHSNQSSSSAYSSSYSSPTSTSNGGICQPGNSSIDQQQTINSILSHQSRLNEWTNNATIPATSTWLSSNINSLNSQSMNRPMFNGPTSNPMGFNNSWSTNLATQLMNNNQLQNYLMRNNYKVSSPRRTGLSPSFGSRESPVIPSKVPTFVLTDEDIATVNTISCKKDINLQLYFQSLRKNVFAGTSSIKTRDNMPRPIQFNGMSQSSDKLSSFLPTGSNTDTILYELLNQDNNDFHPSIQDSPIRKFHYDPPGEKYSRKVFVGGLPPDIDEREIHASFCHFGSLDVDWPHKSQSRAPFPPKGYAFLLFHEEYSVQALISMCKKEGDKYYYFVSSPTLKDKQNVGREFVQIRPWSLQDADFVMDGSQPLDPRKTIFVGGVPRPLRSVELAVIMNKYYSGVCYAGIDVDPELKYPKGAGRVAFSNHTSYINAINNRFIQLKIGDIDKKVEVKPYVMDDQMCDECNGDHCGGKYAPFFCGHISCLRYFCEHCWSVAHSQPGREFHKPLVKEGADRNRSLNFRW